ncbi:sensor histidine kinase [Pseudomonas putida]|nr:sensor histidine kinase [Pseudomonas putida]
MRPSYLARFIVGDDWRGQTLYSRLTSEHHAASGGLGLGLFIVGEIVARHGGAIDVESSVQYGNVFRFSLPTS